MINDIKRVYNNGNTVVVKFKNGDSKVAKCHPNDKFDLEKGILLCLAQENGYTYEDIATLSENTIPVKPSEKRKERKDKVKDNKVKDNKVKVKREFFVKDKTHLITIDQFFNYLTEVLKF